MTNNELNLLQNIAIASHDIIQTQLYNFNEINMKIPFTTGFVKSRLLHIAN